MSRTLPDTVKRLVSMVPAGPWMRRKLVLLGLPVTASVRFGSPTKVSTAPVSGFTSVYGPLTLRRNGPTSPLRAPEKLPGAPMPMSRVMLIARRPGAVTLGGALRRA